jgi:hypothetical protein
VKGWEVEGWRYTVFAIIWFDERTEGFKDRGTGKQTEKQEDEGRQKGKTSKREE